MKNENPKKITRIHISVHEEQADWLSDLHKNFGMQISPLIRRLIDKEMKRQKKLNGKRGSLMSV